MYKSWLSFPQSVQNPDLNKHINPMYSTCFPVFPKLAKNGFGPGLLNEILF